MNVHKQRRNWLLATAYWIAVLLLTAWAATARPAAEAHGGIDRVDALQQAVEETSLMFIENVGQFAPGARFQARGGEGALWLAEDAIWVTILAPAAAPAAPDAGDELPSGSAAEETGRQGVHLRLSFAGAAPAALEPFSPLETTVSYFHGSDPAAWRPAVPVWGGVRYAGLYPGVDLELAGAPGSGTLQPRLVCRAADCTAALAEVTLQVEGAEALAAGPDGLEVTTAAGRFTLPWLQVTDSAGRPLEAAIQPAITHGNLVRHPFAAAPAASPSAASPAVSPADAPARSPAASPAGDPTGLLDSTFLGGGGEDRGNAVAVSKTGDVFVTGYTRSTDFPTTPGSFDPTHGGLVDAFVARLSSDGGQLLYSTFLGGGSTDEGYGIAVDEAGNAFVTGKTRSLGFPTTAGAFDMRQNGRDDAFVTRLNASGSSLLYSTVLGSTGDETGFAIAIDSTGTAFVTGRTNSPDFPVTAGALDASLGGSADIFVTRLNAAGSGLLYSTFLGGSEVDTSSGIVIDGTGTAFITGETYSSDFPTTAIAFDTTLDGDNDAFIARISATGSGLIAGTLLGGSDDDAGYDIALDGAGNVLVTGYTYSPDFPTTAGAFDTDHHGDRDSFIAKFNALGSELLTSTYLGGSDLDEGSAIALDGAGNIFITGVTASADFPTTPGAVDSDIAGVYEAFIARLTADGGDLTYSTLLGGGIDDYSMAIAVDEAGTVFFTGFTDSPDFPVSPDAFDTIYNGGDDTFVARLVVEMPDEPPPDTDPPPDNNPPGETVRHLFLPAALSR